MITAISAEILKDKTLTVKGRAKGEGKLKGEGAGKGDVQNM